MDDMSLSAKLADQQKVIAENQREEMELEDVFYRQPMEDYLAHPAIGSSLLKKIIADNPAEFLAASKKKNKETKATILGTAVHTAILEPNYLFEQYAFQPQDWGPRNVGEGAKLWNAFKKEHSDKICLGFEEAVMITTALEAGKRHAALQKILSNNCRTEVTAYTDYGDIALKSRIDILEDDQHIWDVKTHSGDMSIDDIQKTIYNNGYHFQGAQQFKVFTEVGFPIRSVGWIFISTQKADVHIVIVRASRKLLDAGLEDHDYAVGRLRRCMSSGEWPGYSDEITEISLPNFAAKYYED